MVNIPWIVLMVSMSVGMIAVGVWVTRKFEDVLLRLGGFALIVVGISWTVANIVGIPI